MASTPRPQPINGTAPLPPLGPPRSGNGGAGLSPSLSGPSRRRRHAPRQGPVAPVSRGGEAQAQEEAAGAEPQLLLHGRQVPRLLQDHDRVQPCPDRGALRGLLHGAVPAHGGQGPAHRGLLVPAEAALSQPGCHGDRREFRPVPVAPSASHQ